MGRITDFFPSVTARVLSYLIENRSKRLWYHKIAADLDVSTTSVIRVLRDLHRKKIIKKERLGPGRPTFIALNEENVEVRSLISWTEDLARIQRN